jgi:F-type H+/Na+-transporting ATPase subunit alpha
MTTEQVEQTELSELEELAEETFTVFDRLLEKPQVKLEPREVGVITFLGHGIATVDGLAGARSEELLRFPGDVIGMVFNLDEDEIGVILLGNSDQLRSGANVYRTGRVMDVPVGKGLLGRVVDSMGRPLDEGGPIDAEKRLPVERSAPSLTARRAVNVPLQTGIKVIDALFPIGRGQRELILGDRQTGKTAIALDTIINQQGEDVICIYCAVGQRNAAVAKLVADLRTRGALDYCVIVVASGETAAGLQFIAPYAATSMAEYFRDQGRDVLIIYDDLTRHARAYRELSLLLRRPPSREAYPGDIFYLHSRLLERSAQLSDEFGGGSLTALPVVETEAQNLSAYIPTNIISITDGQIYVSPDLFRRGVLPAVDIGKSVSRVGGKAQLAAYRAVAETLRISYSQFEELEAFARFGTRLDERTRKTIERGRRVREVLKQTQYSPLPVAEQIAIFLAVTAGLFDDVEVEHVAEGAGAIRRIVTDELPQLSRRVEDGKALDDDDREAFLDAARRVLRSLSERGVEGYADS